MFMLCFGIYALTRMHLLFRWVRELSRLVIVCRWVDIIIIVVRRLLLVVFYIFLPTIAFLRRRGHNATKKKKKTEERNKTEMKTTIVYAIICTNMCIQHALCMYIKTVVVDNKNGTQTRTTLLMFGVYVCVAYGIYILYVNKTCEKLLFIFIF